MIYAILSLMLFLLVYGPTLWVRLVMSRHSRDNPDLPGTGAELARHLIEKMKLDGVQVEECGHLKDHYDPTAKTVRLGPGNYSGRSLTAVAVAAHEVGHAIQFGREESVSKLRSRYMPMAMMLKRIGIGMMWLVPIAGFLLKSPVAIFGLFAISLGFQLLGALAYLIILPEEWDASFNKAMPILMEGGYIQDSEEPAVRSVLRAAALTYFAAALADMLNITRWIMVLLRR